MSRLVPILDNGHGGMIGGVYQTAGKRSPKWELGTLYEGMFNRWIVNGIIEQLDIMAIPYYHVSPEPRDVSLGTRCDRANTIHSKDPNTYLLSIHANIGGGKGTGIEGFTSTGATASDRIAELFLCNIENDMCNERMRFDYYSDGDRDKERDYRVLTGTNGPALLMELGFMDHPSDYKKLWDKWHRQELINSLVGSIDQLYNE
ncbi:N-acetylmuramoyl-L-alanine amidase [Flagellimonas marina]|uniref:N-acetylmuramoyl-L-alanine amidase n=1 Tax=Flagellimonas marina TaxID=1775168 RepID=A0ABV8PIM1_9FLAO